MHESSGFSLPLTTSEDKGASAILWGLLFLLPFLFIPSALFPLQFSKVMLALLALVLFLGVIARKALSAGSISVRWSWLTLAFLVLPLCYALASVFSSVPGLSFFGYQLEQDTFGFIALVASLAIAISLTIAPGRSVFYALASLLFGAWALFLFQGIQLFLGTPIDLGIFSSAVQNLIGKWNDVGLFAALVASLVLLSLEVLSLSAVAVALLLATLAVSLLFLIVVSFPLAWFLLGAVAFATLVFSLMRRKVAGAPERIRGIASAIVLAVAVFFVFFGSGLSGALSERLSAQALEVSPSFTGTLEVLTSVYEKSPVFGSGPNTFASEWFLYRPSETLTTPFWATEFSAGMGYTLTALVTGGIVVGAGWLLLIGAFLFLAFRSLIATPVTNDQSYFLLLSAALGSAFLLAAHVFYVPSQSLSILLFVFLGLFMVCLSGTPLSRAHTTSFGENPRLGFVTVLAIAIALVAALASLYGAGAKYASAVFEAQALTRLSAGDIEGALATANQAVSLSRQDRYLRTLTALHLADLGALVRSGVSDEEAQERFQRGLADALTASRAAVDLNPLGYANWMSRASVYAAVVPLEIEGAFDNAIAAFETARPLNPRSPEVDYQIAALKVFVNDRSGARAAAAAAIEKKADYTPAILLIAQIALSEGNLSEAIASLKSALVFAPNDPSLLYQIGLLELQNKEYQNAAAAFARALEIAPDFANAAFFLGQAKVFLGEREEALRIFQDLEARNPDNAVLNDVIAKLKQGVNPFADAPAAPLETSPRAL